MGFPILVNVVYPVSRLLLRNMHPDLDTFCSLCVGSSGLLSDLVKTVGKWSRPSHTPSHSFY